MAQLGNRADCIARSLQVDYSWSQEQEAYKGEVLKFAQRELNDDLVKRDGDSEFSRDGWRKCADFGIQAMSVSCEFGGRDDLDFLTAMLAMEAMGEGCRDNGLTFALNAQMWTVQRPIDQFGSAEQKQRFLPGLCSGDLIGCHAITEEHSGSDVFSMRMLAENHSDGYRLNGSKRYVSLAPIADVALVFASIDPSLGKWGVTAFLVETSRQGCSVSPSNDKMGLRTVPIGDVHFDNCIVPEENRLGPEGAGVSLSTSSLEWERCCILASQLGAMERQLHEAIAFSKEREQFGQPIGKFQSISNRIADMKLRLETSRLLLYKVAWLKQMGRPAMLEAALLKLHLSESFVESSLDAIRIHGGKGYMSEHGIERDLRDAVGGTIYAGTSDIQRNIVAGLLGL